MYFSASRQLQANHFCTHRPWLVEGHLLNLQHGSCTAFFSRGARLALLPLPSELCDLCCCTLVVSRDSQTCAVDLFNKAGPHRSEKQLQGMARGTRHACVTLYLTAQLCQAANLWVTDHVMGKDPMRACYSAAGFNAQVSAVIHAVGADLISAIRVCCENKARLPERRCLRRHLGQGPAGGRGAVHVGGRQHL